MQFCIEVANQNTLSRSSALKSPNFFCRYVLSCNSALKSPNVSAAICCLAVLLKVAKCFCHHTLSCNSALKSPSVFCRHTQFRSSAVKVVQYCLSLYAVSQSQGDRCICNQMLSLCYAFIVAMCFPLVYDVSQFCVEVTQIFNATAYPSLAQCHRQSPMTKCTVHICRQTLSLSVMC